MSWYIAKSLETLRLQLNALFPNRSKVSDGGKGDDAHSSRKSDHNPNGRGAVTARDFTLDTNPADGIGIDCHKLAKVLFASKDKRIKYIIFNGQITKPDMSGWKTYSGVNPHKQHLHLSVASGPNLYDNDADWDLSGLTDINVGQLKPTPVTSSTFTELKIGAKGEPVHKLQEYLMRRGCLRVAKTDGDFGTKTERAVKDFQILSNLRVDGIVGPNTAKLLGLI